MKVNCPFCQKVLMIKFKKNQHGMSYLYGYCKSCKCSIMKSVRRMEEKDYEKE